MKWWLFVQLRMNKTLYYFCFYIDARQHKSLNDEQIVFNIAFDIVNIDELVITSGSGGQSENGIGILLAIYVV